MVSLNTEQIIAYIIYTLITTIAAYIAKVVKNMREDKNSFYSREKEFIEQKKEALKQKMRQDKYSHGKEVAQDIIYKVEQLGKEMAWDATTKHNKATEWISEKTGLTDEQIFDIIKTTVGMLNQNK